LCLRQDAGRRSDRASALLDAVANAQTFVENPPDNLRLGNSGISGPRHDSTALLLGYVDLRTMHMWQHYTSLGEHVFDLERSPYPNISTERVSDFLRTTWVI